MSELLGDVIDPLLYTPWCEPYPQAGDKFYEEVSAADRVDGRGICAQYSPVLRGVIMLGFGVVVGG